ncbi:MAG: SDR family oxidoreductase [Streptosporangiales bacterium]|nr:SDR family oxidoreductase [Streptosporangiales bacterium]
MDAPLTGKVAIVTGGSRGIGAATAVRLARDGADVLVTYERSAARAADVVEQVKQAGRRAVAVAAPAADDAAVTAAVDRAVADFGRLDILVNNAAVLPVGTIDALTAADFDEAVTVNVRAVFVAVKAAARHLGEGGRIITIGSNLAARTGRPGVSLYALTKSAVIGFSQGLARDLGPRGITVNVVQPGNTDTEMNPAETERAREKLPQIALGRYGEPDDVASMVAYLAGDAARYVTGATLTVDGGQLA